MFKHFPEHGITVNAVYIIVADWEPGTPPGRNLDGAMTSGTRACVRLYTTEPPPKDVIMKFYDDDTSAHEAFNDISKYLESVSR